MSVLNFLCLKCHQIFDFNVGKVDFTNIVNGKPSLEYSIECPKCGIVDIYNKEVELSDLGEFQFNSLFFDGIDINK